MNAAYKQRPKSERRKKKRGNSVRFGKAHLSAQLVHSSSITFVKSKNNVRCHLHRWNIFANVSFLRFFYHARNWRHFLKFLYWSNRKKNAPHYLVIYTTFFLTSQIEFNEKTTHTFLMLFQISSHFICSPSSELITVIPAKINNILISMDFEIVSCFSAFV